MMLAWVPGPIEMGFIAVIALLLFGRRLPEMGRGLGKGISEFKKGLSDTSDQVTQSITEAPKETPEQQELARLKAEIEKLKADKSAVPPAAHN
jgi:sec-independent protein translocase protein TatA